MNMTLTSLLASDANGWDHNGWWLLWPLVWLAVIVTLVLLFKRRRWGGGPPQSGADRARDLLAERFARGEIAGDEYRERLEQLR